MGIDYRLTVKCQDCYAVTTYSNERPEWKVREPDPKRIRQAKRWLALPDPKPRPIPAYVGFGGWGSILGQPSLEVPASYRYVVCPACDGKALPYDARDDAPDAEQAAS